MFFTWLSILRIKPGCSEAFVRTAPQIVQKNVHAMFMEVIINGAIYGSIVKFIQQQYHHKIITTQGKLIKKKAQRLFVEY